MTVRMNGAGVRLAGYGMPRAARLGLIGSTAIAVALGQTSLAFAVITNTAEATGTAPGGGTVTATDTENTSVETATPQINIVKDSTFIDGGLGVGAEPGDVVTYTYTITNTGNVTLTNVTLADVQDGTGAVSTPALDVGATTAANTDDLDGTPGVDTLLPGETLVFTADYTITQADIDGAGGSSPTTTANGSDTAGDNDIDSVATTTAVYLGDPGVATDDVTVTDADVEPVPLFVNQALVIDKVATVGGVPAVDVSVGDVITYTYTVTNTGNTNIDDVTVTETTFTGTGTAPSPVLDTIDGAAAISPETDDNDVDTLAPGSVAVFTATYTVTQQDVDELQ